MVKVPALVYQIKAHLSNEGCCQSELRVSITLWLTALCFQNMIVAAEKNIINTLLSFNVVLHYNSIFRLGINFVYGMDKENTCVWLDGRYKILYQSPSRMLPYNS